MLLYISKGYFPIKHRYKSKLGEIDLILTKGSWIVFCEVKWRSSSLGIENLLSTSQQRRLKNSTQDFLAKNAKRGFRNVRMDIALVRSIFNVEIFKNWTI